MIGAYFREAILKWFLQFSRRVLLIGAAHDQRDQMDLNARRREMRIY